MVGEDNEVDLWLMRMNGIEHIQATASGQLQVKNNRIRTASQYFCSGPFG